MPHCTTQIGGYPPLFNTSRNFVISPAHQDEATSSSLRSHSPGPQAVLTLKDEYHQFPQVQPGQVEDVYQCCPSAAGGVGTLGKEGKTEIFQRLLLKAFIVVLSVQTCNLQADCFKKCKLRADAGWTDKGRGRPP
jgi:hypothetical protein